MNQHTGVNPQDFTIGQNHAALNHILQLANVARPGVLLYRRERSLFDVTDLLPVRPDIARDEIIHQHRYVTLTFTQGWHVNRKNIQSIKQVHPKPPLANFPSQIFVGRRDYPHVRFDRAVAAEPFELPLLQNPQKRHLDLRTQLRNFVEKDGAAVGSFEPDQRVVLGAPVNAPSHDQTVRWQSTQRGVQRS